MEDKQEIMKYLKEIAEEKSNSIEVVWEKWTDKNTEELIQRLGDSVSYYENLLMQLFDANITDTMVLSLVSTELLGAYTLEHLIDRVSAVSELTK